MRRGIRPHEGRREVSVHAWAYSFDGSLIGTPHVGKDEINREEYGLWPVAVEVWQGFIFVHLDPDPTPLEDTFRADTVNEPLHMAGSTSIFCASATGRSTRSRPTGRS